MVYPYLLRDINIEHKDQLWNIEITYIPKRKGHMYLLIIIYWHTRKIINLEQGAQFTSIDHISLIKGVDISISMDSVGRATDNNRIKDSSDH